MKKRASKKLNKALSKACSNMEKPETTLYWIFYHFKRVLYWCGCDPLAFKKSHKRPIPYEGFEEIASRAMIVLSILFLEAAEEHIWLNYVKVFGAIKQEIPEPCGESWPGLADKAIEYARKAIEWGADDVTSSKLGNLSDAVIQRAEKVKQEKMGFEPKRETKEVSRVIYCPNGWDVRAWHGLEKTELMSQNVQEYIRSLPNGDWLLSELASANRKHGGYE